MQYFSKKQLVLPESYYVNSSPVPLAKDVNNLLLNCGCDSYPVKSLKKAIQQSNFFFTIQSKLKNKISGFVRVTSDRDLKSSVSLRNKTIIPLGFLQVSLLRRLRDQTRQPPISEFVIDKDESRRAYSRSELLRGALLTINGIAAGMRNTG